MRKELKKEKGRRVREHVNRMMSFQKRKETFQKGISGVKYQRDIKENFGD